MGAGVADVQNALAADAVMNGKAAADERHAELAGEAVAFAGADEEVGLKRLSLGGNAGKIGPFANDRALVEFGCGGPERRGQAPAASARGAEHGDDADLGEQRGEPNHEILLAVHDRPFFKNVFVAIDPAVDEPAALGHQFGRQRLTGIARQQFSEAVGLPQTDGQTDTIGRHSVALREKSRRRFFRTGEHAAEFHSGARPPKGADCLNRRAAGGKFFIVGPGRTVEGFAIIGQHGERESEGGH